MPASNPPAQLLKYTPVILPGCASFSTNTQMIADSHHIGNSGPQTPKFITLCDCLVTGRTAAVKQSWSWLSPRRESFVNG